MGWYFIPNSKPKCLRCGLMASGQLFNTYNAASGDYCKRCGEFIVKLKNKKLKQRDKQLARLSDSLEKKDGNG